MDISTFITNRTLMGAIASMGVVTTGVVGWGISDYNSFDSRVKRMVESVGLGGCVKKNGKFICKVNKEGIKKIKFSSKHNFVDKYDVSNSPESVDIEIFGSGDVGTFPDGIGLIVKGSGNSNLITVGRDDKNSKKSSGWSPTSIGIWTGDGELKVKNGKVLWVWEEVNDLANKMGIKCSESDGKKCNFESKLGTKLNVMVGDKKIEGLTFGADKKIDFDRGQANFFQGYKFTPESDIELLKDGVKVGDNESITKLENKKTYQITRDKKDFNKWYLSKVGS